MSEKVMTKRRGRSARKAARAAEVTPRLSTIHYGIKPVELVSADELERIHQASMWILKEVGVVFRDPQALEDWKAAGADVRGETVRFEAEMIEGLVAKAPARFEMTGRGEDTRFQIGLGTVAFAPTHGPPNIRDLDGVRRFSTIADLRNINKIVQMSPGFHMTSGFSCEPTDIPVPWRHLHINHSSFVDADLATFGMGTGQERSDDSVAMAEIVYGRDFLRNNVVMMTHVSGNSPLVWDETMLSGLRTFVKAGQGALISPFVLGAANTPADVVSTVAQLNAEALSGIAYAQLVRPGAPVIYGQFSVAVSMKTGAPMSGMPEINLLNGLIGQLARRYDIPWRTTASQSAAKSFDPQSGYESATSYMAGITANCSYMLHAGGWDEAGMVHCLSKLVVDAEQNLLMAKYAAGVTFDLLQEGLEAVQRIGPGGHFLGDAFTLKHFQTAFSSPEILDYEAWEHWQANGSRNMQTRARDKAVAVLKEYQAPTMDIAVREALDGYVETRQEEISPLLS
ncbi:MAG: trimethylamine methyltransferase family protein [Paracoccaceae bacterium]